jgi:hypothetical protein
VFRTIGRSPGWGERPFFIGLSLGELEESVEKRTFRLFKGKSVVWYEVISEYHWKVVAVSGEPGPKVGDEVSPVRRISPRDAKRRVNSHRTSMSPHQFVLLRGEGCDRSDEEVARALRERPWDPDHPPAA